MRSRTLALTCACLLGLAAGASAQTPTTSPPAAAPGGTSTGAPPAGSPGNSATSSAPPAAAPTAAPAPAPVAAAPPAPATAPPAASASTPAPAPTRIRGSILAVAPHLLTVASRDHTKLEVTLTDPLTVVTVKRVPLSAVANGSYVGIASRGGPNGTRLALEVLVFPEAMRGAGAGHYPWDLEPGSMMTNAPVTGVTSQKSGRDLTLTYQGGTEVVHVPPKVPVVTFMPATEADLKRGSKVFIIARTDAAGHLSTGRVTVGTHGVTPPM